ncbi:MAG: helix-turn-helix domain-containing protein [Anaerolineae bacterium]|nr:helix-turn-helix domain-containing protein [Anaerolineae bacterium]
MAKGQRALLPPEDEQRLQQVAASGSEFLRRRAKVILDWHEGKTAADTARHTKLSENQVRYLWRLYRQKGLDLFMVDDAPIGTATKADGPAAQPEPAPESRAITIAELCAQHDVDMNHAAYVVEQAQALFDATVNLHRLPASERALLEAAGLTHDIAFQADAARHAELGHDIVLAQPLEGFSDDERRMIACMIALHAKKSYADREAAYLQLPQDQRYDALALSAILRIADGLDSSNTQQTTIADIQIKPEAVAITADGPQAEADAQQAQAKADLWNRVFNKPLRVATAEQAQTAEAMPDLKPDLNATMSVSRAGRRFARHTLDRIDGLIPQVQNGHTALLPVLAREVSRLNEAIVLADAKDFRKEARWLLDTIEEARLAAALVERVALFQEDPYQPEASALASRAGDWQTQAQAAIRALDVQRYTKLASDLRLALAEDVDLNEHALIGFHVGSILWEQLAALRDVMEHGTSVIDALDAARRLQDHLIAFRDLLGPEIGQVLDMLSPLEGYLSAIRTTQAVLARLEPEPVKKGRKKVTPPLDPGVAIFRDAQTDALNSLADSLPAAWSAVNSVIFRRAFALAVAAP